MDEVVLTIRIKNWEKFNGRKDVKNPTWIRVDHKIIHDPKLHGLGADQRWIWVFLLCHAGSEQSPTIQVSLAYLCDASKCDETRLLDCLEIFNSRGMIEFTRTHADGSERARPYAFSTDRTDKTNRTDITNKQESHFASDDAPPPLELVPSGEEVEEPKFHPIAEIWNKTRGVLPAVLKTSGKRATRCRTLWRTHPSTEYWANVFLEVQKSPGLLGENDRGWTASFDWILEGENRTKVLEGNYRNWKKSRPQTYAERVAQANAELLKPIGGTEESIEGEFRHV